MLKERARLEERDRQLVETALVGVEQLAETVDEFLDLTRIEAGQLRLSWDRIDVAAIDLYIAREIVEAHGGTISCEAGPEGRGARLAVVLPVEERRTPHRLPVLVDDPSRPRRQRPLGERVGP
jgi:NtrC-family two-component system sensor histidine kinase KinB